MATQRQLEEQGERAILPPLYELAGQYAFLADLDTDGDFDEALAQLGSSFSAKAQAIMQIVVTLEGQAGNFKAEADRIATKARAMENRATWLRDYLRRCMEAAELDRVAAGTFTLSLQKSPPKCEITDPEALPRSYRRIVPVSWVPDSRAIIDHWKATGETTAGALISVGRHLRVR